MNSLDGRLALAASKAWLAFFDKSGHGFHRVFGAKVDGLRSTLVVERFFERVGQHERCRILFDPSHFVLQQLDYLQFLDIYHPLVRMFHVKDAEFRPNGRQGIYGGYADWTERAGRFRSLGDGQVDFAGIFSKLSAYGFDGWAVLEWECCLKDAAQGAAEGAAFIERHMITRTRKAFDDFASVSADEQSNRRLLGLGER